MNFLRSFCVLDFVKCSRISLYEFVSIKRHESTSKCKPPWNILFYGTDSVSLESLQALNKNRLVFANNNPCLVENLEVVTKNLKTDFAVRQYAEKNNLKTHYWPHWPTQGQFDVGIVVSFGHLIPHEVIQAFPLGMLNVHCSLLPRWRGAAPIANAILNGDTETGVTIMQIAPHEFDVGKIVLQQTYSIANDVTTSALTPVLAKMGADLLIESLKDLCPLLERSKPQDSSLSTKAPKLKQSQAFIKWNTSSCQYIDRLYRAFHDSVNLETSWHGTRIKLINMINSNEMAQINVSRLLEMQKLDPLHLAPGKFIFHKRRKILCIKCCDGWVGFDRVLIKGYRSMTALEFYNGFISKVGVDQHYFD